MDNPYESPQAGQDRQFTLASRMVMRYIATGLEMSMYTFTIAWMLFFGVACLAEIFVGGVFDAPLFGKVHMAFAAIAMTNLFLCMSVRKEDF